MVSSKCCQVESPSPFRFLAALMPPCAQTECERFTGTMENRSTLPPISAILITAARPARPPPTTIIFGAAAMLLPWTPVVHWPCVYDVSAERGRLREAHAERVYADQTHDAHK